MHQLLSRLNIKYYNQKTAKNPLRRSNPPHTPEKARILPPARHAPRGRDGNYGNAVLATTGGHSRAGCTTEHRASEQSALYHKKPLCVRRTSCPAVSECGVSTHSIQTSPRSRSPQPIEACAAGYRGGRARFVPPTPKENRKG